MEKARHYPQVIGAAPYVELQAMVGRGLELSGATVRGILPEVEPQVSDIGRFMVSGTLKDLTPGSRNVILGVGLAWALQAQAGDELTVLIPRLGDAASAYELRPRMETFVVSGIFEAGVQEQDGSLALMNMSDAAALAGLEDVPSGLRLKFADIFAAPLLAAAVGNSLDSRLTVSDWSKENSSYFRAVRIEKTMMTLILMLIVGVAAFNIVAALVMVVNEKRTDIAILRTVGLAPRSVIAIFMAQGIVIGGFGTLLGVALGLALAENVETLVPLIERTLGVHIMDPDVYYITQIPSEVHWPQVALIAGTALVLTVLATIYPSLRAARTEPADALRYE